MGTGARWGRSRAAPLTRCSSWTKKDSWAIRPRWWERRGGGFGISMPPLPSTPLPASISVFFSDYLYSWSSGAEEEAEENGGSKSGKNSGFWKGGRSCPGSATAHRRRGDAEYSCERTDTSARGGVHTSGAGRRGCASRRSLSLPQQWLWAAAATYPARPFFSGGGRGQQDAGRGRLVAAFTSEAVSCPCRPLLPVLLGFHRSPRSSRLESGPFATGRRQRCLLPAAGGSYTQVARGVTLQATCCSVVPCRHPATTDL